MKIKITEEQRAWMEYGRALGRLSEDRNLAAFEHEEYGYGPFVWTKESLDRGEILAEARQALQKALAFTHKVGYSPAETSGSQRKDETMSIDEYIEETINLGWRIICEYKKSREATPIGNVLDGGMFRRREYLLACGNILNKLAEDGFCKDIQLSDRIQKLNRASWEEFEKWGGFWNTTTIRQPLKSVANNKKARMRKEQKGASNADK